MNLEKINKSYWSLKVLLNKDVISTLVIIKENPGCSVTQLNRLAWYDPRYVGKTIPVQTHLMYLNKYGYVHFVKDGKWRKYYASLDKINQVKSAIKNFIHGVSDEICHNAPFEIKVL